MSDNEKDIQVMTACIYGEARNQGVAGMLAVGSVVMNRWKKGGWFGSTIQDVILKPKQFSCFNAGDRNRELCMQIVEHFEMFRTDAVIKECWWIAKGIIEGYLRSNIDGATHYLRVDADARWEGVMVKVGTIGVHDFYKEYRS